MGVSGCGACGNLRSGNKVPAFEGVDFKVQFEERDYESYWDVVFNDSARRVVGLNNGQLQWPIEQGDGDIIPEFAELGLDVAVPTLVGLINPWAGAGAAITLAGDNIMDILETPTDNGDTTIPRGNAFVGDYFSQSFGADEFAFYQRFNIRHGYDPNAHFWVESTGRDTSNTDMSQTLRTYGWAFKDEVPTRGASTQSEPARGVDTLDPEKMTQEERDKFGIRYVQEPDQETVTQTLDAEQDVKWIANDVPFAFEHEAISHDDTYDW